MGLASTSGLISWISRAARFTLGLPGTGSSFRAPMNRLRLVSSNSSIVHKRYAAHTQKCQDVALKNCRGHRLRSERLLSAATCADRLSRKTECCDHSARIDFSLPSPQRGVCWCQRLPIDEQTIERLRNGRIVHPNERVEARFGYNEREIRSAVKSPPHMRHGLFQPLTICQAKKPRSMGPKCESGFRLATQPYRGPA